MVSRVLHLLTLAFTIFVFGALLLFFNWQGLGAKCLRDDTCDILSVDAAIYSSPWRQGEPLGNALKVLFLGIFCLYLAYSALVAAIEIRCAASGRCCDLRQHRHAKSRHEPQVAVETPAPCQSHAHACAGSSRTCRTFAATAWASRTRTSRTCHGRSCCTASWRCSAMCASACAASSASTTSSCASCAATTTSSVRANALAFLKKKRKRKQDSFVFGALVAHSVLRAPLR